MLTLTLTTLLSWSMSMAGLPSSMASAPLNNKATNRIPAMSDVTWGRRARATTIDGIVAAAIVLVVPFWMNMDRIALRYFDGSLSSATSALWEEGVIDFAFNYYPRPSRTAIAGYTAWIIFQAVLYVSLPGRPCRSQRTPGGQLLEYTANGLLAWVVTHVLFLAAALMWVFKMSVVADHWDGLVVAMDAYGIFVSAASLLKGHFAPSFVGDRKLSSSIPFDFFSGVELNPRLGKSFDIKFFHNGRAGIVGWTLINASFAAFQYNVHGYVSNSMLVGNVLQAIYVVDFFINEDWYLRTVDIAHDHFGFYLAYGTTSFLPQLYTIQAQYLARYPTQLDTLQALGALVLGVSGYALFRSANWQKDVVRRTDGATTIWGESAKVVRTKYHTSDGKEHDGLLLACGWWGVCRHINYLADLIQTFAMCIVCGFDHLLPWLHMLWMCLLLLNRLQRDERRCRAKYGKQWEKYCEKARYRLVPGIW
ncbi:7-dehydrocholesterol reductase [Fulvia fulva]|uniref:7-dehydrocholesterol reductase n=1 Tax=Passalora fulva TaxID=5499 RepID=A0A9Q8PFG7_PASFU|nr:7-dehydrocholesterol reductase [Fulvia fulva]KAK4613233.1 7-dehydrocholesterol reductase [Fulvia fulva]UJO21469.1 7-dehydrocholesterol reductase [Fulvia fulva]WPV20534.1 7-dehydrocholesterol reductase [Fulvia fulva]WPV35098.1 7-dehydrocholesterol reductase [Fulvia fulva]